MGQYYTNCKEEWVENFFKGGLGIGKSPYQRKDKNQWVIKQKATKYSLKMLDQDTLIEQSP